MERWPLASAGLETGTEGYRAAEHPCSRQNSPANLNALANNPPTKRMDARHS